MIQTEHEPRLVTEGAEGGVPEISVVIPVFNEEETVPEVYRRAVEALEPLQRPYELIFVDDGSRDATWAALQRLHASDSRLRAVRLKRNFGQHPAMHAGFVRARGQILVTMDADLQNDPADLPKLIAGVEAGFDVASGRRVGRADSPTRTLPSAVVNGMLRRFTARRYRRLRLCLQCLSTRSDRPGARGDRQAEVH